MLMIRSGLIRDSLIDVRQLQGAAKARLYRVGFRISLPRKQAEQEMIRQIAVFGEKGLERRLEVWQPDS